MEGEKGRRGEKKVERGYGRAPAPSDECLPG